MGLIFGYLWIFGLMVVVGCLDTANSARGQSIGSIIVASLFGAVIYGSMYFAGHAPMFAIGGVSVGIAAALVACVMERPQVGPAVGLVVGATSFLGGAGFPFGEMPFGNFTPVVSGVLRLYNRNSGKEKAKLRRARSGKRRAIHLRTPDEAQHRAATRDLDAIAHLEWILEIIV